MESTHFLPLIPMTQFLIGQLGDSCAAANWLQMTVVVGLVAVSGIVIASTGVGLAGIATTLVGLIAAGASIDTIASALGTHIILTSTSLEALGMLVAAIRGILGC